MQTQRKKPITEIAAAIRDKAPWATQALSSLCADTLRTRQRKIILLKPTDTRSTTRNNSDDNFRTHALATRINTDMTDNDFSLSRGSLTTQALDRLRHYTGAATLSNTERWIGTNRYAISLIVHAIEQNILQKNYETVYHRSQTNNLLVPTAATSAWANPEFIIRYLSYQASLKPDSLQPTSPPNIAFISTHPSIDQGKSLAIWDLGFIS